ncbi:hypothetical protein BGZ94_000666 [Podila epigama]|nr:hypothetical protein BGZ94_000666 [Podila epigama]
MSQTTQRRLRLSIVSDCFIVCVLIAAYYIYLSANFPVKGLRWGSVCLIIFPVFTLGFYIQSIRSATTIAKGVRAAVVSVVAILWFSFQCWELSYLTSGFSCSALSGTRFFSMCALARVIQIIGIITPLVMLVEVAVTWKVGPMLPVTKQDAVLATPEQQQQQQQQPVYYVVPGPNGGFVPMQTLAPGQQPYIVMQQPFQQQPFQQQPFQQQHFQQQPFQQQPFQQQPFQQQSFQQQPFQQQAFSENPLPPLPQSSDGIAVSGTPSQPQQQTPVGSVVTASPQATASEPATSPALVQATSTESTPPSTVPPPSTLTHP